MNGEGVTPPLVASEVRWVRSHAPYPVDVELSPLPRGTWQLTVVGDRVQLEARYGSRGEPFGAVVVIDGEAMPFHYTEVGLIEVLKYPGRRMTARGCRLSSSTQWG